MYSILDSTCVKAYNALCEYYRDEFFSSLLFSILCVYIFQQLYARVESMIRTAITARILSPITSNMDNVKVISRKVHILAQICETVISITSDDSTRLTLRLTNVFAQFFSECDLNFLLKRTEIYMREACKNKPTVAYGSGLFKDMGENLDSLDGLSKFLGLHNALRHFLAHLLVLPFLGLENLVKDKDIFGLIDKCAIDSFRNNTPLQKFEDFRVVLKDFCYSLDAWFDPADENSRFLMMLSSIQGWSSNVEYLESMIGRRSRKPGPGLITYKEFNKRVLLCESKKNLYVTVKGPYSLIVNDTVRRLNVLKKAQLFHIHPDTTKPFVIGITGESGTGKSEAAKHIARFLLRKEPEFADMEDEDLDNMMFNVTPTSKWIFEGYNPEQHYVFIADEVGTIVNPLNPIHPNLLKIMEHGSHQADQASVDLKGRIPFCSKIVILITNADDFGLDDAKNTGIADKKAWFRRFNIHLKSRGLKSGLTDPLTQTPRLDAPRTLNVAVWNKLELTGSGVAPVCVEGHHSSRPQEFSLMELFSHIEAEYTRNKKRAERSSALHEEDPCYYVCHENTTISVNGVEVSNFSCSCCERCDICGKTEIARARAPCSVGCKWNVEEEEEVEQYEAKASSSVYTHEKHSSFNEFVHNAYIGALSFLSDSIGMLANKFIAHFVFSWPISRESMDLWRNFLVAAYPALLFFPFVCSPLTLSIWSIGMWGLMGRPKDQENVTDYFFAQYNTMGVRSGLVRPNAFLAQIVLKAGIVASSVCLFFVPAWSVVTGVSTLIEGGSLISLYMKPIVTGVYVWNSIKWQTDPVRYFPLLRNNVKYNNIRAKFSYYGIDMDKFRTNFAILFTFFATFSVASLVMRKDEGASEDIPKFPAHSEVIRRAHGSADRPNLPFTTPFCDVVSSKVSFWGSKTEGIIWPKSTVTVSDLIEKVKANMVRLEVRNVNDGSTHKVGGFYIESNLICSVYHATRLLVDPNYALTVRKMVNGNHVSIVENLRYTTDKESTFPPLSLHIDHTNDIVAFCAQTRPYSKLTKYVVQQCNATRFKCVIVYNTSAGDIKVESGEAESINQSVCDEASDTVMYTARHFAFKPSNKEFKSFQGICGGVMIAFELSRSAIVGVISATFIKEDMYGVRTLLAAALPIIQSKCNFHDFAAAIPASAPDILHPNAIIPLEVRKGEPTKRHNSYYVRNEGRMTEVYNTTEIIGFVENSTVYPKSSVEFYPWKDDIFREFPEFVHSSVPPKFRSTIVDGEYLCPYRHCIEELSQQMRHPFLPLHVAAVKHLYNKYAAHGDVFDLYAPLEYRGAYSPSISGVNQSTIFQGIRRTTGAGFPFAGKKSDYLVYNEDLSVGLKPEIVEHIDTLLMQYSLGTRQGMITRGTLKDEPRSKDKVDKRKIRVFAPCEFDKFLCSFIICSAMVQISVLSRTYRNSLGGMSVFSREFSDIRQKREKQKPLVVALDFRHFDKSTSFLCKWDYRIVNLMCIHLGRWYKSLTEEQKVAFNSMYITLSSDSADSYLLLEGELLSPGHGTDSGGHDTYDQNCFTHSVIAREAALIIIQEVSRGATHFLSQSVDADSGVRLATRLSLMDYDKQLEELEKNIDFFTHGDDGLYPLTTEYVTLFNFESFRCAFAWMNMECTLPDKSGGTGSHYTWDQVDIGKRKFRWEEKFGLYMAPLNIDSIGKMLTIGVVKNMTVHEKMVCATQDAVMEFAQYGEAKYNEWIAKLAPLCAKWKVDFNPRPWIEVATFNRSTREYEVKCADPTLERTLKTVIGQLCDEACEDEVSENTDSLPRFISAKISLENMYHQDNSNNKFKSDITYDITEENFYKAYASSDNGTIVASDDKQETHETAVFKQGHKTYSLDVAASPDETFNSTRSLGAQLGDYLTRPVEIYSTEWTIGTDFLAIVDPWALWRADSFISNKLRNYAFYRSDLEIKILINGTPFHYGQLMVAYAPMLGYYGEAFSTGATAAANAGKSTLYNFRHYAKASALELKEITDSYFSTYQHVLVGPGDNLPIHMDLPFMWHHNYLELTDSNITRSDGTSKVPSPGSLVLTDLVGLNRSNDTASNKVQVNIWAIAKNIELHTPTTGILSSEVQKGGFVSSTASAVKSTASKLTSIPGIAPYAKATEMVADKVGAIATLFGFSRPIDPSPVTSVALSNARNIAVTNISDTSQKLAFDVNQELTVDSRVIGADGSDDMSFDSINGKWYWCGKTPWTPASTSGSTKSIGPFAADPLLLYRCVNMPTSYRHFQTDHAVPRDAWHLNPAGFLASTFVYWNADITYRIQVVASKMHTGRIRIQYDPSDVYDITQKGVNTQFTWILDLSESREIEVTIPYVSDRNYLKRIPLDNNTLQDPKYSTTTSLNATAWGDTSYSSGYFSISIMNDLVSPNGAAGVVYINVWKKIEPGAEYQLPATEWHSHIIKATGASEVVPGEDCEAYEMDSKKVTLFPGASKVPRNLVFFGERVLSIRSLLKRYTYLMTQTTNINNNGMRIAVFTLPHFPETSSSGWTLKNTYVSYFSSAFLAKRGSMRYKHLPWLCGDASTNCPSGSSTREHTTFVDRVFSSTYVGVSEGDYDVSSTGVVNFDTHLPGGYGGGAIFAERLGDSCAEVESPYYNNARFHLAPNIAGALSPLDDGCNYIRLAKIWNGNSAWNAKLTTYSAAGEDYSLMLFQSAPVLYAS